MKKLLWIGLALAVGLAVFSAVSLTRAGQKRVPAVNAQPAIGGVQAIVSAQPFVLDRAWTHTWRAEQPQFDAGWLVVLAVDPTLVVPTQREQPVLYAGAQTVERVNVGEGSGRLVVIIPSMRDGHGGVALDLASTPIWFGAPDLPERVTGVQAAAELERAIAKGVRPLSAPPQSAGVLHLPSRDELQERTALLVLDNAPDESELGLGLLAPRVPVK